MLIPLFKSSLSILALAATLSGTQMSAYAGVQTSVAPGVRDGGGGHYILGPDGKLVPYDTYNRRVDDICPKAVKFEAMTDPLFRAPYLNSAIAIQDSFQRDYPKFSRRLEATAQIINWYWCPTRLPLVLDYSDPSNGQAGSRIIDGTLVQAAIQTGSKDVIIDQELFQKLLQAGGDPRPTLIHEIAQVYLGKNVKRSALYSIAQAAVSGSRSDLIKMTQELDGIAVTILGGRLDVRIVAVADEPKWSAELTKSNRQFAYVTDLTTKKKKDVAFGSSTYPTPYIISAETRTTLRLSHLTIDTQHGSFLFDRDFSFLPVNLTTGKCIKKRKDLSGIRYTVYVNNIVRESGVVREQLDKEKNCLWLPEIQIDILAP